VVDKILETGANDVLVIRGEREHLVHYVPGQYVLSVDLAASVMVVDWDPEF
jgi:16S rRNA processing protein RimM